MDPGFGQGRKLSQGWGARIQQKMEKHGGCWGGHRAAAWKEGGLEQGGGGGEGGLLVEAAYLASFAGTPKATHDDSRTWVAEAFWELRARVFKI